MGATAPASVPPKNVFNPFLWVEKPNFFDIGYL